SLIKAARVPKGAPLCSTDAVLRGADDQRIVPRGKVHLAFRFSPSRQVFRGVVSVLDASPYDMIVGLDFLARYSAVFQAGPRPTLTLASSRKPIELTLPTGPGSVAEMRRTLCAEMVSKELNEDARLPCARTLPRVP